MINNGAFGSELCEMRYWKSADFGDESAKLDRSD